MYGGSYMFRHYVEEQQPPEHNPIYTLGSITYKITTPHETRHNTPIHNILSTAPQLSISQKALGTLAEDGNIIPKHVGATLHN
jgi:hypothetical protein